MRAVSVPVNNAKQVLSGTVLATVAAVDRESDPLTFSMTTVPNDVQAIEIDTREYRSLANVATLILTNFKKL